MNSTTTGLVLLTVFCLFLLGVFLRLRYPQIYNQLLLKLKRNSKFRSPLQFNLNVPSHTRKKLMTLLNGDRATAERLLAKIRQRNPGKSETWYWEKVILDLQRDRRY